MTADRTEKQQQRDRLEDDTRAYLAAGGEVSHVPRGVSGERITGKKRGRKANLAEQKSGRFALRLPGTPRGRKKQNHG